MKSEQKENVLYVETLGGFSLEWNGKQIMGRVARESQFSWLMQMLLHYRELGVSREEMKEALFDERDVENANHALQSVIYNAKRKLKAVGLPQSSGYIRRLKGRYYWTEEIPVVEDAREMERIFQEAEVQEDLVQKRELYLKACYLYGGEFLRESNSTLWAAQEAKKYHYLFCASVESAAELLRKAGDFARLEELGNYASRTDPLSNWETVTLEAMVASGHHQEARRYYNDTLELYRRELGVNPSGDLQNLMKKMDRKLEHGYGFLEEIQKELAEDIYSQGGYFCSYPIFMGAYQMMLRLMERGGQSVFLMLCTIVDEKGNPLKKGDRLEELSEKLKKAICRTVRRCDVVSRYGSGQYLVLLTNTTGEDCTLIQKRIDRVFIENRQRIHVQYHTSSVEDQMGTGELHSLLYQKGE